MLLLSTRRRDGPQLQGDSFATIKPANKGKLTQRPLDQLRVLVLEQHRKPG